MIYQLRSVLYKSGQKFMERFARMFENEPNVFPDLITGGLKVELKTLEEVQALSTATGYDVMVGMTQVVLLDYYDLSIMYPGFNKEEVDADLDQMEINPV